MSTLKGYKKSEYKKYILEIKRIVKLFNKMSIQCCFIFFFSDESRLIILKDRFCFSYSSQENFYPVEDDYQNLYELMGLTPFSIERKLPILKVEIHIKPETRETWN